MVRPFKNSSRQFGIDDDREEDVENEPEEGEEFSVALIKDCKFENGKKLYLVEWCGYPGQDEWIPPENFNGRSLIDEFEMRKEEEMEKERQSLQAERQQLNARKEDLEEKRKRLHISAAWVHKEHQKIEGLYFFSNIF